jgi:DinB superfamily
MTDLNPYAMFLDGRPVETILNTTPHEIGDILSAIGMAKSTTPPTTGKWSAAEIICHLADCEIAFGFRLRQTLAEQDHVIQPLDQDKWAPVYSGIPAQEALAAFTALRHWNMLLIARALPGSAAKTVTHPERGTMTFQTIVETMAGHDLNHMGQLRNLAA